MTEYIDKIDLLKQTLLAKWRAIREEETAARFEDETKKAASDGGSNGGDSGEKSGPSYSEEEPESEEEKENQLIDTRETRKVDDLKAFTQESNDKFRSLHDPDGAAIASTKSYEKADAEFRRE